MTGSRLFSSLFLLVVSVAFAEARSARTMIRDSHPTSIANPETPGIIIIAQLGKSEWQREMDARCREWDLDKKSAPSSAAWTCVNGRAATQQETNEILERMRREAEHNWQRTQQQNSNQQKQIKKLSSGSSRPAQTQQEDIHLGPQITQTNQSPAKTLSLPADWRFAHPHPDMLIGIRVSTLRQSSTLQELLSRLAIPLQENAQNLARILRQIGQLDQVWVSIRSSEFVGLVQGQLNFPPGFVELSNGMSSYRISNTAVVIGKSSSVAEAVQRMSNAAPAPALARRMKEIAADNDLWFTGTRALKIVPANVHIPDDITDMSLSASLRDGLRIQMRLNSGTVAGARRLLADLHKNPVPSDSKFRLDTELVGTSVRLELAIAKSDLLQAVDKALASPIGQQLTKMAVESAQSSNKIVVQGMPGGSKEIRPSGQLSPARQSPAPLGKIVVQGGPDGTRVISPPH